MKLLEIKNLEIQFPSRKSTLTAVNNVSLSVDRGDILGIVGESGAGKSTVGNALIGLLEPPGIMTNGEIYLEGQRINDLPESEKQKKKTNTLKKQKNIIRRHTEILARATVLI